MTRWGSAAGWWVVLGLISCGRGDSPPSAEGAPTDRSAPEAASPTVPPEPTVPIDPSTDPSLAKAPEPAVADGSQPAETKPTDAKAEDPSPDLAAKAVALRAESLAYVAYRGGPFPTMSDEGPRLVLLVDTNPEASVSREALASEGVDASEGAEDFVLRPVEPKRAYDRVGLRRVKEVWLVGPDGPCQATLGPLYALGYAEGPLTLEMGHRIEPCTESFAPVAYLGSSPPPAKWQAATRTHSDELADPHKWAHPRRAAFETIGLLDWKPSPDEPTTPDYHVRIDEAGPAVLGLSYAYHWPGPECEESESITQRIGTWTKGAFAPLPPLDEYVENVELIGALYVDDDPLVVVGKESFQMYLAHRGSPGWEWTEVLTGGYHDEDTAYSGWSVLEHYCGP